MSRSSQNNINGMNSKNNFTNNPASFLGKHGNWVSLICLHSQLLEYSPMEIWCFCWNCSNGFSLLTAVQGEDNNIEKLLSRMCLSRAYIVHLQGGKSKILIRNFTHEGCANNMVIMNSNNQNIILLLLFRMPRVVHRYEQLHWYSQYVLPFFSIIEDSGSNTQLECPWMRART